jgi:ubiquinone biosynthesis protein
MLRKIKEKAPYWTEKLPELPDLIYNALINQQPTAPVQSVVVPEILQQQLQRQCRKQRYLSLGSIALLAAFTSLLLPTGMSYQPVLTWSLMSVGFLGVIASWF